MHGNGADWSRCQYTAKLDTTVVDALDMRRGGHILRVLCGLPRCNRAALRR